MREKMKKGILLCVVVVCAMVTVYAQSLPPSGIDTLLRHHFADSNLVIIDVCTDAYYVAGHLQNAVHSDLYTSSFSTDVDGYDKGKLYLLHCIGGGRSASAMSTMKGKGFARVYDISGGITNWRNSGYSTTTSTTQSKIRFVTAQEMAVLIKNADKAASTIVDLRSAALFEEKHLVDAVSVDTTKGSLPTHLTDKARRYFIYGTSVSAVDSAVLFGMYNQSYEDVFMLKSGFESLESVGLDVYVKPVVVPQPTGDGLISGLSVTNNHHVLMVNIGTGARLPYSIYSIDSRLVQAGSIEHDAVIAIEGLSAGVYVLRLGTTGLVFEK